MNRRRLAVAGMGVAASALALGVGLAFMADGGEYGPSMTAKSAVGWIAFFALNPLHFALLQLGGRLRWIPSGLGLAGLVVIDLGWWWLVSGWITWLLARGERRSRSPPA